MTSSKNNMKFLANLEQSALQSAMQSLNDMQARDLEEASPEDEMTAYLYGLLSEEESHRIESEIASSPQSQLLLQDSKQKQSLFGCWQDQDVPSHLFAKTLARIGIEDDAADANTDGTVNPGTTAC
ncbi:MAG: hypothetical protein H6728_13995 [Myxococcales bacterium]|nr:hypothetical protein [Myxococcales bacterium]MCB9644183.1 hypothetical protein [Myxococcales bacterium]